MFSKKSRRHSGKESPVPLFKHKTVKNFKQTILCFLISQQVVFFFFLVLRPTEKEKMNYKPV